MIKEKVEMIFREMCFYICKEIYTKTNMDISELTLELNDIPTKLDSYAIYVYDKFEDGRIENRSIQVSYDFFKEAMIDDVPLDKGLQGRNCDFLIAHELGHYIHEKYLNNKYFDLPKEGMIKNSKINYKENFADAFGDWLLNINNPSRNKAIEKILRENNLLN